MIILRASTPGYESSPRMKTWPASKFGQHYHARVKIDDDDFEQDDNDIHIMPWEMALLAYSVKT